MATRQLNDLDPACFPIFVELLARFTEAGIPVQIINVLRTEQEQEANLAKGVSATMNSRHLPQPPSGKSHAIDVCPYMQYVIHGAQKLQWDSTDPAWDKLGIIGEALGLRWGGRWQHPHDPGHFEWNPKGEERVTQPTQTTQPLGSTTTSSATVGPDLAPAVPSPPQLLPDEGTTAPTTTVIADETDIPF